jgi:hypothetical protein
MMFETVLDTVQLQINRIQAEIEALNNQKTRLTASYDNKIKAKQAALSALTKQQQNKAKTMPQQPQQQQATMPDATKTTNNNNAAPAGNPPGVA